MRITRHIDNLTETLAALRAQSSLVNRWGVILARRLTTGSQLLTAGNGGSAAQAQHLSAELVGKFRDDRRPFCSIPLTADTAAITAIANDYGYEEVFARQVTAYGKPLDVLLVLSTSGRSENLLRAVDAAHRAGMTTWALTGPAPNPLARVAEEALCLPGGCPTVQEGQLVAVHMLCSAFEQALSTVDRRAS